MKLPWRRRSRTSLGLDPEVLNRMSTKKLGETLVEFFAGKIIYDDASRDDTRGTILERVYSSLDPTVKETLQAKISALVGMVLRQEVGLPPAAARDLLLSAGRICSGARQAPLLTATLEAYLSEHRLPHGLTLPALQALLELGFRGSSSFWISHYTPEAYEAAVVVLTGLSRVSVGAMADWFRQHMSEPHVFDALMMILPALTEDLSGGTPRRS